MEAAGYGHGGHHVDSGLEIAFSCIGLISLFERNGGFIVQLFFLSEDPTCLRAWSAWGRV